MTDAASLIADNLADVRKRIANAAQTAGRSPDDVRLVAVTKYVDAQLTAILLEAGCLDLGESRPQQLWAKAAEPTLAAAQWHLIGHLQRNKVRATLPLVQCVHSVDSLRLLETIDKVAASLPRPVRVLLEVNCSGEVEKHGFSPTGLRELLPELPRFAHVEVGGLMTMAARSGDLATAAKNFATLRQLRDTIAGDCPSSVQLTDLSMGMSHDFEVAIAEGATIVRVGSSLVQGIHR